MLRARSSILFWPLAAAVLRAAARLPGVLAGFTADLGLGLRPGEGGKAFRHAGGLNKVVGHVDEELEGEAEAIFNETGGKKDGLSGTEAGVAMADGAVAQIDGVAGRDHGFAGVGDGEGNEVVGALLSAAESVAGTAPTRRSRSGSEMRVSPHAA